MRLLHLSDLHIGKHVNEFPMLDDQKHVFQHVLDALGPQKIDAVLIAGDVYDKSAPSAEAVALADWFLSELIARGVAVLVIPGNHDSAERIAYGGAIMERQGLHVAPRYTGTIMQVALQDEHGTVVFWLVPFLRPALVRPFAPDEKIENYTDALRWALRTQPLDQSVRNVALAHQFVTAGGASPERCDSETVAVGGVDNVDAAVFDGFDYVALGHIHTPQHVGRQTVRYAGSPLKYSFSERAPKRAPIVSLGAKGSEPVLDYLDLPPLHDMREIRGPLDELVAEDVVAAAPADDYLHVTLTDENPPLDALARLRAAYPNVMTLDFDNARTRAAETSLVSQGADKKAAPLELFRTFFAEQNGADLTPAQDKIVQRALDAAAEKEATRR